MSWDDDCRANLSAADPATAGARLKRILRVRYFVQFRPRVGA